MNRTLSDLINEFVRVYLDSILICFEIFISNTWIILESLKVYQVVSMVLQTQDMRILKALDLVFRP